MSGPRVVVVGAGIAGCAAAVAAAEAGARVTLCDAAHHLGGVAVRAEHRSICGLAPIDAAEPELLEGAATAPWLSALGDGEPWRRGRVWLWPCSAERWQAALRRRLDAAGVACRLGTRLAPPDRGAGPRVARVAADRVIDASGSAWSAPWCEASIRDGTAWGAHRCLLELPPASDAALRDPGSRRRLLRRIASPSALDLVPADGPGRWQASLDVAPGTTPAAAAAQVERLLAAWDARIVAHAWQPAERDRGGFDGALDADALFATTDRGWCWAAWPVERHGPTGTRWRWPPADRHGVPAAATRPSGAPDFLRVVGAGMAVAADAAAALRVTGTALALGHAVGRWAAGT